MNATGDRAKRREDNCCRGKNLISRAKMSFKKLHSRQQRGSPCEINAEALISCPSKSQGWGEGSSRKDNLVRDWLDDCAVSITVPDISARSREKCTTKLAIKTFSGKKNAFALAILERRFAVLEQISDPIYSQEELLNRQDFSPLFPERVHFWVGK